MKTLKSVLITTVAALLCVAPAAHAEIISGETRAHFQYDPSTNNMTINRIASYPLRSILVRVYELSPTGIPSQHRIVAQKWVATRTTAFHSGTVGLRIRNLKGSSGIRYAFTVTPQGNLPTNVLWDLPDFVPQYSGKRYFTNYPFTTPYVLPRIATQLPTSPVVIEDI